MQQSLAIEFRLERCFPDWKPQPNFVNAVLVSGQVRPYNRCIGFVWENLLIKSPSFAATSGALSVLIADSNRMQAQLLSTALRRRPEFQVASCALDMETVAGHAAAQNPRVVVFSFSGPTALTDTLAIIHRFHLSKPQIPKILLTDFSDRDLVVSAFRSGVRGIFTISDANLRLLCKCLLRVAAGQVWANSTQLNYLIDSISEVPSLRVLDSRGTSLLTPREEQVVALVAEGLANRQIASELSLSEHTIKKYLFRIFEKLGISSRVELVLYAVNHGDPRPAEWLTAAPSLPSD
jgi:DNA-binding NarL/FixJ family response regulator